MKQPNDLIERYVYAVTKRLPAKLRADVSRELYGLIDDMLAERCGELVPADRDVRVVLTELGSPGELREKYTEGRKNCLIGPPHYAVYRLVLGIVLACVIFGMAVACLVSQLVSPTGPWYAVLFEWLGILISALVYAFAFVTVLFAVFHHRDVDLGDGLNLDDLPPVPKKRQSVSRWECLFGIGISVLFLAVFLSAPQIFCIYSSGRFVPIFDTAAVRATWYFIALFSAAGIVRETVKLMRGRYDQKVMLTTLAADAVSAVLSVLWLTTPGLVNPAFQAEVPILFGAQNAFLVNLFSNFPYFFLGLILFALLLDAVDAVVRAARQN